MEKLYMCGKCGEKNTQHDWLEATIDEMGITDETVEELSEEFETDRGGYFWTCPDCRDEIDGEYIKG